MGLIAFFKKKSDYKGSFAVLLVVFLTFSAESSVIKQTAEIEWKVSELLTFLCLFHITPLYVSMFNHLRNNLMLSFRDLLGF
jgi:hypothetical protein